MITRRSWFVYGTLLAIWLALIGWQGVEHVRVAGAISSRSWWTAPRTFPTRSGCCMRSQRFFGVISKESLESALKELVKPGSELHPVSVEVVNMDL